MQSQPSSSSAVEDPTDLTIIFKSHMDGSTDSSVGKSPMYIVGSEKTPTIQVRIQVNDSQG